MTHLFLISSSTCSMEIGNLFYAQKIKLINAIKKLPFDYVLIDLGAGTNFNTLDFLGIKQIAELLTNGQPASAPVRQAL